MNLKDYGSLRIKLILKRHKSPAEKKSKVNSYNTATGFYFQRNILNLLIKDKVYIPSVVWSHI